MSKFCPILSGPELRAQLIALGLLRPRTSGPAMKRFRNAAGAHVLRMDRAGHVEAARAARQPSRGDVPGNDWVSLYERRE